MQKTCEGAFHFIFTLISIPLLLFKKRNSTLNDHLANLGHSKEINLHVLSCPPSCCGSLLNEDVCGVSFRHSLVVS